jgi:hypothetical protein
LWGFGRDVVSPGGRGADCGASMEPIAVLRMVTRPLALPPFPLEALAAL